MSKKFLHICLTESWGGLEMAVGKWNRLLDENGHQNLNICSPHTPLVKQLKEQKSKVLEWEGTHYFSPNFTWQLRKLVQKERIEAVVLQNLRDLWIVAPALYGLSNIQLVGFAQMLIGVKKTDLFHRLVYQRMNHALTLTDWQQTALRPFLPIQQEVYKTIPNFVDCNQFHPKHKQQEYWKDHDISDHDFVIGIIGRIDEQKGQLELLQAFRDIDSEFPNLKLVIVGGPTLGEQKQEHYFERLMAFVKEKQLSSKVRFIPFQSETHHLTANFDLFVLPSYRETFGFVLIEAMASGTAVLASDTGGPPEILGHGDYGYLYKARNHKALVEQLKYILRHPQEAKTKKQQALQRVRDFYDRQKVYKRFMQIVFQKQ